MSKCPLIAKAIVYAVRQGSLINQYGLRWEDIEANTANILAGASVPADGVRVPPPAAPSPEPARGRWEHLNGIIRRQIDSLKRISSERDNAVNKCRELTHQRDVLEVKAHNTESVVNDLMADLARVTQDRNGYKAGAGFWMDQAKELRTTNGTLVTALREVLPYVQWVPSVFSKLKDLTK